MLKLKSLEKNDAYIGNSAYCDFALFCHLSMLFFFHSQILFLCVMSFIINIQMSFFYKELSTTFDQNNNNNKQEIGK